MVPPTLPVSWWTEQRTGVQPGPVPILADKLDPSTGEFLDLLSSHTVVDGLVIEAYRVEANTGVALDGAGNTLREVRHTSEADLDELKARARAAVRPFELEGLLEFQKVDAENTEELADGCELEVWIKDLTVENDTRAAQPFKIPRTNT